LPGDHGGTSLIAHRPQHCCSLITAGRHWWPTDHIGDVSVSAADGDRNAELLNADGDRNAVLLNADGDRNAVLSNTLVRVPYRARRAITDCSLIPQVKAARAASTAFTREQVCVCVCVRARACACACACVCVCVCAGVRARHDEPPLSSVPAPQIPLFPQISHFRSSLTSHPSPQIPHLRSLSSLRSSLPSDPSLT
jgi:hypothetical protein